jgi:hypothetical protein
MKNWRLIVAIAAAVIVLAGACVLWRRCGQVEAKSDTGYHAVLLTNGQVYYGKLAGLGTRFPVLTEVFYVQVGVDPATKESKSVLLKRGKEWHAPDRMILNARHIILVEPVTSRSKMAELIAQAK